MSETPTTVHPRRGRGRRAAVANNAALAVLLAGTTFVVGGAALAAGGTGHDAHTAGHGEAHGSRTSAVHSRAGTGAALATARRELARYGDVEVALADGYVPVSPCETSAEGGMGVHYLNPALVGSTDPLSPAILLYEPTADGGARLLGAEWFAVDADQDLTTDEDRPSLLGQPFDGPMPGHSPEMPVHYDLHVWLYEANPAGVFAPWNPRVDCEA